MKRIFIICIVLASFYMYPVFSGLILLPLDFLVTSSGPWNLASQLLIKNTYMQDSVFQMFPWKHLTYSSLLDGVLPLWNPYQFMGMPFMAGMKSLVFYPANILFVFGEIPAWNGLLWLQLFFSLWFTFLLVCSLGVGVWFALFAAVAFAFNSLMMGVLQFGSEGHVLLWLPLLLYLVRRFIRTPDKRIAALFSFSVLCALLAGHLQYFAYSIIVVIAFAFYLVKIKSKKISLFFSVLAALFFGVLLGAVQILSGIEMFQLSYRGLTDGYFVFTEGLLKPYHLLRLLAPDWLGNPVTGDLHLSGYIESAGYFGVIPLFFTLYAYFSMKRNRYVKFFAWVFVIAVLLSMDGLAQIIYFLKIPVITGGFGSRIFSIALFSGALLSGFGLQEFFRSDQGKLKHYFSLYYVLLVTLCFAAGLFVQHLGMDIGTTFSNIKIQVVTIGLFSGIIFTYFFLQKKWNMPVWIYILALTVITYMDLFRMGYRFLTFSNPKFLYPDLPITAYIREKTEMTLGRTYGLTLPEVNSALKVAGIETYNPLYPYRTARLMSALENVSSTRFLTNKYEVAKNLRLKYVMDFLGVTHIVVGKGQNPAGEYWKSTIFEADVTKVYENDKNDVYINTSAYPRYGIFFDAKGNVSDDEALAAITDKSVDFQKTVLISEQIPSLQKTGTASAILLEQSLNNLKFKVNSSTAGIFYISDTYYPGWKVAVNGNETPLLRANYNFRAVLVPEGESEIDFWYMPKSFVIGAWVSFIAAIGGIFYLLLPKVKRHR